MKQVTAQPLVYDFSADHPPRVRIEPGERLLVESEDALSGQLREPTDRRDKSTVPLSNPVAGPIVVEGAKPGDALAVTIHEIRPRDGQAATYVGHPGRLAEWLGDDVPPNARICPIRDDLVHWDETTAIPYQPMLGCIGTASDWGVASTQPAGRHGGNLDLVEVCPGATVYLPVLVDGGFLYLGDAHAAMGHGELSGTGLEMAAETEITVDLVKQLPLAGPRIESQEEIMTVASGSPMERSIAAAFAQLILWLESDFHLSRWQAYDLLTHVGRISVGYYGIGTVATKIARHYLPRTDA